MPAPHVVPDLDALLGAVRSGALLHASPAHGEVHWLAVAATGLDLYDHARAAGLPVPDPVLLVLFGLLHDCRRVNEAVDPGHGPRAAEVARWLAGERLLLLTAEQLAVLTEACELHDTGAVNTAHATIGACYDADRLQLPRVGIAVDHSFISTPGGRDMALGERVLEHHAHDIHRWHDLLAWAVGGATSNQ